VRVSDDLMQVELVAADRLVWSGRASNVVARTTEGDVGILPGHAPMLALLVQGVVEVVTDSGESWVAAVDSGFLSVANNLISILSEHAQMSHDIDLEAARNDLERSRSQGTDDNDAARRVEAAWADARIRAAERAS
jgi:F-type H+-transporting ATPase subunit epsilon